jgi:hypothetical protein
MPSKRNLKKIRFIVLSLILVATAYYLSGRYIAGDDNDVWVLLKYVIFIGMTSVLSTLLVQYLEGGKKEFSTVFFAGSMPFFLVLGCFLFYCYYPNLSLNIKILASAFYVFLLYTLLLLNNVVLVVGSREVNIPVYRAALNWVQIILLSSSILLFTSFSRLQIHPLIQLVLITLVSLVFYGYLLWVFSDEREIKAIKSHEALSLIIGLSSLVGWAFFSVIFFPTESFLRGLFVSSVFLLGLGYVQLYLKNSLSKRNLRDYLLICSTFFVLVLVFRP